jgi:cysteinyl-tRNA synthetase
MAEIIELCQKLIASGNAYAADGNVWFDVTKDPNYGALSGRKVEEQASGLRDLEGGGKRHPADFALWKAVKPGEPAWESPWGPGRPGWHIECSAMAMKYLGETFDMHGGGLDLMFPHHENERAQSECATGKPFAKFWMHNGLTRIKTKLASGEWADEKMSGSIGNVVPVTELLAKHGAELLRYLILQTHYRRPIEFTDDVITASRKGLSVFHRLFERVERLGLTLANDAPDLDSLAKEMLSSEGNDAFTRDMLALKMKYLESMDDDFNTAGAISVLHEMAGEINAHIERSGAERNKSPELMQAISGATMTIVRLGRVLGLFVELKPVSTGTPQDDGVTEKLMQLLIKLRAGARQSKNFALADDIRKGLAEIGITLEDRPDGTGWRRD